MKKTRPLPRPRRPRSPLARSKETKTDAPVADRSAAAAPPTASARRRSTTHADDATRRSPATRCAIRRNILSKRSVFFEFDSNAVKDEYRGMVQAHSKYMADKRDSKIRIEGNCDERGSREYNLALGQRRAESVKKVMTVLGVRRRPHRDRQLRRREADVAGPRRVGLVAEPPRGHQVRG